MSDNNEQEAIHRGFTDEQLREAGEAMKLQSENTALKLEVERLKEALKKIKQQYELRKVRSFSTLFETCIEIAEQALKS